MRVDHAIGQALVAEGAATVFGVVGSGNFHVTNALVAAGARFVAARHEGGAATMADAFSRMSGQVGLVSVHQGCGLTNAMTGITEAAKSRTGMLVLAAEVTNRQSNFWVDQTGLAEAVGAVSARITSADTAIEEAVAAFRTARDQRRTVVLNLPLAVQALDAPSADSHAVVAADAVAVAPPTAVDVAALAAALDTADRPVFIAGRGARGAGCRDALERLADQTGALLATSAVAKGLFNGNPWSLDVSGGFASPLAVELIGGADLIVGWGCALNMWTTGHGQLIGEHTRVVQVDIEPDAIGAWQHRAEGVLGDTRATAEAVISSIRSTSPGYRSEALRDRLAQGVRWRDVPFEDIITADRVDPRALTIALDDILPTDRVVAVDSGNFMGWPSMFLSVPDEQGFCFTQAYQSIGLGLSTAIGAALAQPDRLAVAAVGDGGLLMGVAELETVARIGLPLVVVVYNDAAYGAEVHHFGPDGHDLGIVEFPDTDIAAIARGFGFDAITVRSVADLQPVLGWLDGPRARPLLIDAKIGLQASWWLEEAFRGH